MEPTHTLFFMLEAAVLGGLVVFTRPTISTAARLRFVLTMQVAFNVFALVQLATQVKPEHALVVVLTWIGGNLGLFGMLGVAVWVMPRVFARAEPAADAASVREG